MYRLENFNFSEYLCCESNYLFVKPEANLLQLSINFLRLLYKIILYINTHAINIKLFLLFAGWCKFFYKKREEQKYLDHTNCKFYISISISDASLGQTNPKTRRQCVKKCVFFSQARKNAESGNHGGFKVHRKKFPCLINRCVAMLLAAGLYRPHRKIAFASWQGCQR